MDVPEDLLDLYFKDLGQVALLTAQDEVRLAQIVEAGRDAESRMRQPGLDRATRSELERRVRAGQEAFDRFVQANLRLVVSEATKVSRRSPLELGELIQEGNLGLIRAVEKFDWRRGLKFSTYATWWIRQALQRGAANKERAIRLPVGVHSAVLKVRAAEHRLEGELGRPPTITELAEATNLSERQVHRALNVDFRVASLDKPIAGEEDGAELGALLARAADQPAEEVVDQLFVEGVFALASKQLPERSWHVLQRRFGLGGREPATLDVIGHELGISRESVRKIEQRALAMLRRAVEMAA